MNSSGATANVGLLLYAWAEETPWRWQWSEFSFLFFIPNVSEGTLSLPKSNNEQYRKSFVAIGISRFARDVLLVLSRIDHNPAQTAIECLHHFIHVRYSFCIAGDTASIQIGGNV